MTHDRTSGESFEETLKKHMANLIVELAETAEKLVEHGWTREEANDYLHTLLTQATQAKKKG